MPPRFALATRLAATSTSGYALAFTLYASTPYSVTLLRHAVKPQPCLATYTTRTPPIAAHALTHASVSTAVGAHAESGGGTPPPQPCVPAMVAILKCTKQPTSPPCCHAACAAVGTGGGTGGGGGAAVTHRPGHVALPGCVKFAANCEVAGRNVK
jgi:hypothetical protein